MTTTELVPPALSEASPVRRPSRGPALAFALVVLLNVVLIGVFVDKAWIPSDDGHYVHVAERLANGEVLNAEVEELHPGYVHFIHVWSLKAFGPEVVSLRYPLMALMMAQSLAVFAIFRRTGPWTAATAAMAMSCIGALQIANPTTSLYSLAATVALIGVLTRTGPATRNRAVTLGLLLGLTFLFRQLTAVFVAMGLFAFLLTEQPEAAVAEDESEERFGLARGILVTCLVGLLGYLARSTDPTAAILLGLGPALLLAWGIGHPTVANREAFALVRRIACGAFSSALPLIGYHVVHGSLIAWGRDTFVRSLSVGELDHLGTGRYVQDLAAPSVGNLLFGSMTARVNALYWIALVFAAFALGVALWRALRSVRAAGVPPQLALPFVAVFYALVSVFNQIPYYLYLTAGLSLIAGLWLASIDTSSPRPKRWVAFGIVMLCVVGVVFHAGQPYTRTYRDFLAGERAPLVRSELPRLGLWIDPAEEAQYQELLGVIERETGPTDVVFTMPNNAELYFLSGRSNGFRIFNPTISLIDLEELTEFAEEFDRVAPSLIVHDTRSTYNTAMTVDLLARITDGFSLVATVDHYRIYART